jgi:hypothetical protein
MTAKSILVGVGCAIVIAGCASTPPTRAARCEGPGVCSVVVSVTDCRISVDPTQLDVFGPDKEIHWDLDRSAVAAGYKFAADGVVIKDFDPQREFTDPRRLTDAKFKWHDKNSFARADPYQYGVRVVKGDSACPQHDPGIINHG